MTFFLIICRWEKSATDAHSTHATPPGPRSAEREKMQTVTHQNRNKHRSNVNCDGLPSRSENEEMKARKRRPLGRPSERSEHGRDALWGGLPKETSTRKRQGRQATIRQAIELFRRGAQRSSYARGTESSSNAYMLRGPWGVGTEQGAYQPKGYP